MFRDMVSGANCDGGSNALGQFVKTADRQTGREGFKQEIPEGDSAEFQQIMNPSDRPNQVEIERYMENLSMEGGGVPMFQNDEEVNEFLSHGGDAYDPPQMDWMNNFWGNFVPSNGADAYKYEFQVENPFLHHPAPFDEAMKHYQSGSLTDAILGLEAVVQIEPQNSDAWRWLGTAHADNDEDKLAIAALRRSLEADPENIEALLDAGVSYTNELVQVEALEHLRSWLGRHPEYSNIPIPPGSEEATLFEQQRSVIEMFLQAAEINPQDVDIHTVLGVLWNLTREYNHAEEAFKEALKLDPENPSLWNKLGATQANSGRDSGSKDAVYAYRKALELKPNYIRAWVNMGISYANRKMYDLAAKYYLKALSLHPKPNHIWSYLRLTLNCMDRHDLAALVEEKNVDVFRSQFTF